MDDSEIKQKMIRNFNKKSGQYQEYSIQRVWAKLTPEDIYSLLKNCNGTPRRFAQKAMIDMAQKSGQSQLLHIREEKRQMPHFISLFVLMGKLHIISIVEKHQMVDCTYMK